MRWCLIILFQKLFHVQWKRWCACLFPGVSSRGHARCLHQTRTASHSGDVWHQSGRDHRNITSLARALGSREARPVNVQHANRGVLTWCEKGWSCIVRKSCPVILFPSRLLFRRDGESNHSTHHQFPPLLTFHKLSKRAFQLLWRWCRRAGPMRNDSIVTLKAFGFFDIKHKCK